MLLPKVEVGLFERRGKLLRSYSVIVLNYQSNKNNIYGEKRTYKMSEITYQLGSRVDRVITRRTYCIFFKQPPCTCNLN